MITITRDDVKLNRELYKLAPDWTADARSLAGRALRDSGISTGPTVDIELYDWATAAAEQALTEVGSQQEEPEQPRASVTLTWPTNPRDRGRLAKALDRLYNFGEHGVKSLAARLAEIEPTRRSVHVRRYARHKRDGCYAELKTPKAEYSVWYWEDGRETGYDIPKIVFDALADVPARDVLGREQEV